MLYLFVGLVAAPSALATPVVDPSEEAVEAEVLSEDAPVADDRVVEVVLDEAYVAELLAWLHEVAPELSEDDALDRARSMAAFDASLPWETTGPVDLAEVATLELGEGDRFLGTEGAAEVLAAWGNPPDQVHTGMLFPDGARVFGPDSWGVVVDYEDMGWVDDADASTIDYDDLLAEMQDSTRQGAAARREMGLDGIELVGWAEPPSYDPTNNVLYWARNLRGDDGSANLNYEVRVLGRGGVLSLNAVASMEELDATKKAMEPVRVAAAFVPGQTYADYEPGVDPTAGIGIAALVAGGALAATKGGLLKGLFALLLAGKKFVVIGAVAVGAFFLRIAGRVFGRRAPDLDDE